MAQDFIVGMDFGTTNSGMAVWSKEQDTVEILPLDPTNKNASVVRTAVYITNDQQVHIGRNAVDTYMEQNTGRPVRMEKVWVGEIDVYAEDMHYVTDVYVFADVLSPGRLFLSIKSGLREADYLGTVVGQFYYALEDLIALYLTVGKIRAEQHLDQELKHIVLGRPVRFAFEPEKDRLAQNRLLDAAFRAGYETVRFQYEPIAAAYAYAQTIEEPENILIFDFGGGTLDITIMRLHANGRGQHEILATGGIPVAGDVFDQKLTRAKLPKHFGEGSKYTNGRHTMPIPSWIYDIFADWQKILELQSPENKELLEDILQTSHRPREIEALISLVSNNYGLQMFDQVEQAKRQLSEDMGTLIRFSGPQFHIRQMVTRTDFETIIREDVQAVSAHLDKMITDAGICADQIDNVVRTGGSAEIPVFKRLLADKFGHAKIRSVDAFSSVAAGLGIIAHEISQGTLDLPVFTKDDLRSHNVEKESKVQSANLMLLQKRIALREGAGEMAPPPEKMHVIVANNNQFVTLAPDESTYNLEDAQWAQTYTLGFDDPLLMITNFYRFLLVSPRQLDELKDMKMALGDLHHFRSFEEVTTAVPWQGMSEHAYMTLVTSRGYARSYKMDQLQERIENPAPYQFDHQLEGVPIAALGTNKGGEEIVIANNHGRCLCLPTSERRLYLRGLQAINWRDGERVMSAIVRPMAATVPVEFLLITDEGYGKRLSFPNLYRATDANKRPPILASRKLTQKVVPYSDRLTLVTSQRLIPFDCKLSPPDSSTKTHRLYRRKTKEEKLLSVMPTLK